MNVTKGDVDDEFTEAADTIVAGIGAKGKFKKHFCHVNATCWLEIEQCSIRLGAGISQTNAVLVLHTHSTRNWLRKMASIYGACF